MFARSDLGESSPKTPPPYQNRAIGALVLLVLIAVLLILALGADAAIFTPYNTVRSVTQTWQANHTGTPHPHNAPSSNPNDQQVDLHPTPGGSPPIS